MRIHIFQHVVFEDAGSIEKIAREKSFSIHYTRFFEPFKLPNLSSFDLLIIMGGPMSIYDEEQYPWLNEEKKFIKECISKKKQILGFCLGSQLLADALGAAVYTNQEKEIGWHSISKPIGVHHTLLDLFPDENTVFHWHGDTYDLPKGAIPLFSSEATQLQGFIMNDLWIGLQFHLETVPQSVVSLLKFANNDLNNGRKFVQSQETILSTVDHFADMKKQLTLLLNWLRKKK